MLKNVLFLTASTTGVLSVIDPGTQKMLITILTAVGIETVKQVFQLIKKRRTARKASKAAL